MTDTQDEGKYWWVRVGTLVHFNDEECHDSYSSQHCVRAPTETQARLKALEEIAPLECEIREIEAVLPEHIALAKIACREPLTKKDQESFSRIFGIEDV